MNEIPCNLHITQRCCIVHVQVPAGSDGVERVVLGEYGTRVMLVLRSRETGLRYEIALRRHRKVHTPHMISLMKDVRSPHRSPPPSILNSPAPRSLTRSGRAPPPPSGVRVSLKDLTSISRELQALRFLINEGGAWARSNHTTIGISLDVDSQDYLGPRHILSLAMGSPAGLEGTLKEGDEILAVDGVRYAKDKSVYNLFDMCLAVVFRTDAIV